MKTLAIASLLLTSWLAVSAHAEPAPAPTDNEAAASALVEQAAHAYDQNQLDQAQELLTRAYGLSARPSILYNQAQVLRAKDDCAGALDAYRHFLETTTPDDPNRERALHRRDEMQACADQRSQPATQPNLAAPAPEPPAPAPPAVLVRTPSPPDHPEGDHPVNHRRAMRAGGWALIGVGVLAAGAAAVLAWEAHDNQTELNNFFSQPGNLTWQDQQRSQYENGTRYADAARWCAGIAAAAGAGGAALLIISRPPATTGGSAANPGPPATLVGWSGTF